MSISDEDDDDDENEPTQYFDVKCLDGKIKRISHQYLANSSCPHSSDQLKMQTRVIARRQSGEMPCARIGNTFVQIYNCDDSLFYAGMYFIEMHSKSRMIVRN